MHRRRRKFAEEEAKMAIVVAQVRPRSLPFYWFLFCAWRNARKKVSSEGESARGEESGRGKQKTLPENPQKRETKRILSTISSLFLKSSSPYSL